MWTCPVCQQKFIYKDAFHSCAEKTLEDFLAGKSLETIELFRYFIEQYQQIGEFVLHPAKTRIAFAAKIRFGYIHRLGKNFIDVVFQFREAFHDNLCFYKIAQVPDSDIYNHYCRLYYKEDLTDELKGYMLKAYEIGQRKHIRK